MAVPGLDPGIVPATHAIVAGADARRLGLHHDLSAERHFAHERKVSPETILVLLGALWWAEGILVLLAFILLFVDDGRDLAIDRERSGGGSVSDLPKFDFALAGSCTVYVIPVALGYMGNFSNCPNRRREWGPQFTALLQDYGDSSRNPYLPRVRHSPQVDLTAG